MTLAHRPQLALTARPADMDPLAATSYLPEGARTSAALAAGVALDLQRLGATPEAVAQTLADTGLPGLRGSPHMHPVVRWVCHQRPASQARLVGGALRVWERPGPTVDVELPDPVGQFADAFDAGRIPALELETHSATSMAVNYIIPAGFRWFRHMAGAGGDQVVDEPDAALTESTDELCALRLDPDPGSTAVLPVAPDPAGAHAKLAHQAYADAVRYAIEATGIGVQWCRLNEMAGYREIALALAQSALVARWPDWHAIYAVWSETRGWSYWLIRRAGTEPERKTYWHDPQADPVLPGPKAVADWLHRLLTSGGGDDVATASDPYSPAWRPVGHDSKFEAALAAFAADPGHLEAERARRAGAG